MLYSSAPANSFVGVFDHIRIASQILYSRLQTPYLQVNFHTIWILGSSWVKAMIPILKKTKKNKKVTHAKDTGAGKNTGICGPKLDWEYIKFTFKTLSDPSKFLSQKNKHMRAELVNPPPSSPHYTSISPCLGSTDKVCSTYHHYLDHLSRYVFWTWGRWWSWNIGKKWHQISKS